MKKIGIPAFAILLLSLMSWTFYVPVSDGIIFNMKMTSSKGTSGIVKLYYDTAGTRIEVTASMGAYSFTKVSLVRKAEPDVAYQLDDMKKTYSVTDVHNAETDKADEPATATLIGTDSLNGYKCMHVKVAQGDKHWEVWNTTSIAEYGQFSAVMNKQRYIGNHGFHDALKLIHAEGYPVKTILTEKDGTVTTTELISVERKPLAHSLFVVPADYKKVGAAASYPGMH